MPLLNDPNMTEQAIEGSGYGFSAVGINTLGASEYTLVGIAVDVSGSVQPHAAKIETCLKTVIDSCRKSPRADNLMIRIVLFNSGLTELHGFKPLGEVNSDDYNGTITPWGGTALYDGAFNVVESVTRYGKDLVDQDYEANGIIFVITDGGESGASTMTVNSVKEALVGAVTSESLESMRSILVGVDESGGYIDQYLKNFEKDAGFDQYEAIGAATPESLAKLADFVSRSISAQSQALGTGGPSQSLTF